MSDDKRTELGQFGPGNTTGPAHGKRGGAPLGNTNAARPKLWRRALERALIRVSGSDVDIDKGLDRIADMVVKLALEGDKDAWQEIGNRLDGKPVQAVVGGDDGEPPLVVRGVIQLVKP